MQQPPLLDKSTEHRKHLLLVWNNIHTAQKSHYLQCSRTLGPDWKKEVSLHALHIFPCFGRSKPDMLNELSFEGQTCLSRADFIWKPTDPQEDQQQQNSCPWSGREQSKEQLPLLWPLPAEMKPLKPPVLPYRFTAAGFPAGTHVFHGTRSTVLLSRYMRHVHYPGCLASHRLHSCNEPQSLPAPRHRITSQ